MISTTISRVNAGKHLAAMLNDDRVFLVLPPDRLSTCSRRLRLLVTHSLAKFARPPARPVAPVLYLLDESVHWGRLEPVERAFALMPPFADVQMSRPLIHNEF